MSETIAEQPEPIITPTSSSAVELSSRAVEAGPARRRPSRANSRTAARNAPAAAPPAMRHSESEPRAAAGEKQRSERADRRAAGDAEHVRIGERVARQQLHQRAGERERGAGAEAGEHARHADLPEDLRRRRADAGRAGEHAQAAGTHRQQRGQGEGVAGLHVPRLQALAVEADADPRLAAEALVVAQRLDPVGRAR